MIQANELRIGNWIKLKNSGIIRVDTDNINDVVNNPAIFEPILLTPEILEKAGFKKSLSDFNIYYSEKCYGYFDMDDDMKFTVEKSDGGWLNPPCDYLHQLQNLYFALTGDELEINL